MSMELDRLKRIAMTPGASRSDAVYVLQKLPELLAENEAQAKNLEFVLKEHGERCDELHAAQAQVERLRMHYIGTLSLLGQLSPYLAFSDDENRDCIVEAINDGCELIPELRVKRSLNLIELEIAEQPQADGVEARDERQ